jgi:hypothetical protein
VPAGRWTIDDSSKRRVKRIGDCNNKLHKPGVAVRGQQRQQESHSEQCINHIEDVINHLGNTCGTASTFYFPFSVDYLINCFGAKIAGNLPHPLRLVSSNRPAGLGGYL